jgi:hypothetical protein
MKEEKAKSEKPAKVPGKLKKPIQNSSIFKAIILLPSRFYLI